MLKDSIMWFFIFALVSIFTTITSSEKNSFFFKEIVLNSLKLIIVFEFIINFYTFPLWVELLFLPFAPCVACFEFYIDNIKEYISIKKNINTINIVIATYFTIPRQIFFELGERLPSDR